MDDELISYRELRRLTGCTLGTLYSMVARREIPHLRLGRRLVRFRRSEIVSWLAQRAVPVANEVSQ